MRLFILFTFLSGAAVAAEPGLPRLLDASRHHLGVAGLSEWTEFENSTPRPQLDLTFTASASPGESTLLVRQRGVKATWNVLLNGEKVGTLERLEQPLVVALRVPAGTLRDGENRLAILRVPSRVVDDIVVGEIQLDPRPRAEALGGTTLDITVSDADTGTGLPCRLTLADTEGALAPLHVSPGAPLAFRTGVVYTGDGRARFNVAPGTYVLYAGRGFEYSVATHKFEVGPGGKSSVKLQLRREVPTPGLIAADTHIHVHIPGKDGDSTIDERMLTIAGEGLELAVATDHNHHSDYTEPARRAGVGSYFRPVVGNEVTTKVGHFNAFPVRVGSSVPDERLTDWTKLWDNIRTVTGAQVITLNHPRDLHYIVPFGPENFDATTGEIKRAPTFDCNAIEVVTSAAMQSDIMLLYRDWFALLNHGHRVAAIGASDSHDVSRFIVGQSRTYVMSRAADPSAIDIDEVCESYREGRLLVCFGLLATMTVNERYIVGDLVPAKGRDLKVTVEVHGPSWVTADRVELFANGVKLRERALTATSNPLKGWITWTVPAPEHDVHLVAIATGPGVTAPYWQVPRPYQPASKTFTPRIIGSTNPVWIDADGDGSFSAARVYAAKLVAQAAGDASRLVAALGRHDEAISVQAADLWVQAGQDLASPPMVDALRRAPRFVQAGFDVIAVERAKPRE